MGQNPQTQLVSGPLLKVEKVGRVSHRMTTEQNNIQKTRDRNEEEGKLCCGIFIYSCPVLRRISVQLKHKLESCGFISESDCMKRQPTLCK